MFWCMWNSVKPSKWSRVLWRKSWHILIIHFLIVSDWGGILICPCFTWGGCDVGRAQKDWRWDTRPWCFGDWRKEGCKASQDCRGTPWLSLDNLLYIFWTSLDYGHSQLLHLHSSARILLMFAFVIAYACVCECTFGCFGSTCICDICVCFCWHFQRISEYQRLRVPEWTAASMSSMFSMLRMWRSWTCETCWACETSHKT